jgi:hypothetical protein
VREDGASSAFWSSAEDLAGGCGHGEASRLRRGNAGWHRRKGKVEIIWDSYLTFNVSKVVTSRTNDTRVLLDLGATACGLVLCYVFILVPLLLLS